MSARVIEWKSQAYNLLNEFTGVITASSSLPSFSFSPCLILFPLPPSWTSLTWSLSLPDNTPPRSNHIIVNLLSFMSVPSRPCGLLVIQHSCQKSSSKYGFSCCTFLNHHIFETYSYSSVWSQSCPMMPCLVVTESVLDISVRTLSSHYNPALVFLSDWRVHCLSVFLSFYPSFLPFLPRWCLHGLNIPSTCVHGSIFFNVFFQLFL